MVTKNFRKLAFIFTAFFGILLLSLIMRPSQATAHNGAIYDTTYYSPKSLNEEGTLGSSCSYTDDGTAYTTSTTASGNCPRNKISVSVDPDHIPLGSDICIEGLGNAYAEDTGGGVTGHHIDIFFQNSSEGYNWVVAHPSVKVTLGNCTMILPPPPPPPDSPPAPGRNPKCSNDTSLVEVNWDSANNPAGTTSYNVDISSDSGFANGSYRGTSSTSISDMPNGVSTFSGEGLSNLTPGYQYWLRVFYVGAGIHSQVTSFTAAPNTCNSMATPPAPSVSSTCPGTTPIFTVSWNTGNNPGGTTSYSIDVSPNTSFSANNYWNKPVDLGNSSTQGPSGFNSWPNGSPAMPAMSTGNYYAQIYYAGPGVKSAISAPFQAATCGGGGGKPQAPSVSSSCPSGATNPTFNVSWNPANSPSGTTGYSVDIDAGNSFTNPYWTRSVGNSTSTSGPSNFNEYPPGPSMPAMVSGNSYIVRIYFAGANSFSPTSPLTAASCGGGTGNVQGRVFNDSNSDGNWDHGEEIIESPGAPCSGSPRLQLSGISISAGGTIGNNPNKCAPDSGVGSGNYGYYKVSTPAGSQTVSLAPPSGWTLTTPGSYTVTVNSGADTNVSWFGIKIVPPPPELACGNLLPSEIEAGETVDFKIAIKNKLGSADLKDAKAKITMTGTSKPPYSSPTAYDVVPNPLPGNTTGSVTWPGFKEDTPGIYNVDIFFSGGNSASMVTNPITCAQKLSVSNKPYVRVFGGDVITGSKSCSDWVMSAGTSGGILAFSQATAGNGSGTQLVAQALGIINGFSSAQGRTVDPKPSIGLTVANVIAPYGNFKLGSCPPNYFANKDSSLLAVPTSYTTSTDGVFNTAGSIDITGGTIGIGKKVVAYVEGDVWIKGNITYDTSTAWTSTDSIPSFVLIVKGNIIIDPGVERLEGVYIAQPVASVAGSGTIRTCDTRTGLNSADKSNQCKKVLTMIGSVTARRINLQRTSGTVRDAGSMDCPYYPVLNIFSSCNTAVRSTAAEQFIYSPEVWIRSNNVNGAPKSASFDAITGLPPVF